MWSNCTGVISKNTIDGNLNSYKFVNQGTHESPMSQRAFVVRYDLPHFLAMRNQCGNDTRYVQILKTNLFTLPFVMDFGSGTDKI